MAEVLAAVGAVASVAQLADYASKLSVRLYSYAASVQRADKTLGSLANEVSLASVVLKELWGVLEEERRSCWEAERIGNVNVSGISTGGNPLGNRKSYVSARAVQAIEGTVAECLGVFDELSAVAEKSLGVKMLDISSVNKSAEEQDQMQGDAKTSNPKLSTFNKMKFPFKQPKLDLLRSQLDRLKVSLTLMLQILSFARDYTAQKQDATDLVLQKQMIEQLSKSEHLMRQKYAALKKRLEFESFDAMKAQAGIVTTTMITTTTTTQAQDATKPPKYEDLIGMKSAPYSEPVLNKAITSTPQMNLFQREISPVTRKGGPFLGELLLCFNLVASLMHETRSFKDKVIFSNEQHNKHDTLHKVVLEAKSLELQRLWQTNKSAMTALEDLEIVQMNKMRSLIEELVREMWEKYPVERATFSIEENEKEEMVTELPPSLERQENRPSKSPRDLLDDGELTRVSKLSSPLTKSNPRHDIQSINDLVSDFGSQALSRNEFHHPNLPRRTMEKHITRIETDYDQPDETTTHENEMVRGGFEHDIKGHHKYQREAEDEQDTPPLSAQTQNLTEKSIVDFQNATSGKQPQDSKREMEVQEQLDDAFWLGDISNAENKKLSTVIEDENRKGATEDRWLFRENEKVVMSPKEVMRRRRLREETRLQSGTLKTELGNNLEPPHLIGMSLEDSDNDIERDRVDIREALGSATHIDSRRTIRAMSSSDLMSESSIIGKTENEVKSSREPYTRASGSMKLEKYPSQDALRYTGSNPELEKMDTNSEKKTWLDSHQIQYKSPTVEDPGDITNADSMDHRVTKYHSEPPRDKRAAPLRRHRRNERIKETLDARGDSDDIDMDALAVSGDLIYPRIHKNDVDIETLQYYNIPWSYDQSDPSYYLISMELETNEIVILFEHTRKLRKKQEIVIGQTGRGRNREPQLAWVKRQARRTPSPSQDEDFHSNENDNWANTTKDLLQAWTTLNEVEIDDLMLMGDEKDSW